MIDAASRSRRSLVVAEDRRIDKFDGVREAPRSFVSSFRK